MKLAGITRTVADIEKSKRFYEDLLGFEADAYFTPTHWQSYKVQEGVFFAVGEEPGSTNEVAFAVDDIEALWLRVRDQAEVVSPLEKTPWGTYRFVIRDPDGHLLSFGQESS
ncbi:lactoylglutathione lyase [Longilinea arvoryzae]|uniref:Lactoylglutathione lyase n=1 Tax=Longilinea arvoryzae TaxID=360412 RepID=A0A0S7BFU7_9CHLR|nr:VOC family protein [Longilinea arvoryzae]GAP12641.1 lactoylglutathione lyase [Longilinea arvoryzae]